MEGAGEAQTGQEPQPTSVLRVREVFAGPAQVLWQPSQILRDPPGHHAEEPVPVKTVWVWLAGPCPLPVVEIHCDLRGEHPVLWLERGLHGGRPGPTTGLSSVPLSTIFPASV